MLRLGEEDERGPAISCPPFKLIQMNIVREYLDLDFRNVQVASAPTWPAHALKVRS